MRTPPLLIGCLLLLFTGTGVALAQQDEAAFSLGLKKIQGFMEARRWKRALDLLGALLDDHQNQDYVRARRAEIVQLHKRASFRHRTKEPDPKDLVDGELLSCNLSSGRIKIRYRRASGRDFEGGSGVLQQGVRTHDARFVGPYTIEIKGKSYPSPLGSPPCIWVCLDRGEGFIVSFGFEQVGGGGPWGGVARWTPARIASVKKNAVVAEKLIPLAKSRKPFRMRVKVGKHLVSSSYNGKAMLRVRKPEKLFGYWGFSGLRKFSEIVVTGQAEPSWLQGRIDAFMAKKRKAFERTYRPKRDLPAWLFQASDRKAGPRITKTKKDDREYPGPEPEAGERRFLERVAALLKRGRYQDGLTYLRRIDRDVMAEVRREFLRASCYVGLGRLEPAQGQLKRVCRRDPTFIPAQVKLIEITYRLGRHDDAYAELKRMIEQRPQAGPLHRKLVLLLLREGRMTEAKAALEKARSALGAGEELFAIDTLFVKATKGPDWGRVFHHKSAHYEIHSDIDQKTCARAAQILEDSLRAYSVHLTRVKKDNRRFTVYLFSGQAGFLAHCRDALGGAPGRAAGVYSPILKQLLIWNLPDRSAMMRTVRHEGFHQYLDRIMDDPPTWLNEGLAEYYETADYVNGLWQIGKVRDDHLATLEHGKALQPLEEFIRLPKHQFYRKAGPCYAQAWAFVHFCRHGPARYRELFDKLFEALQGDDPTSDVLDRVFGEADLDLMDTDFRLYVKQVSGKP